MKMKKMFSVKILSIILASSVALLYSCKKDNDNTLSSTDSQNVNSESVSASTSNEASDLGNSVISNVSDTKLSQARVSGEITGLGLKDRRLLGATIIVSGSGTRDNPSGIITIDYGTTGVTTDGVTRQGKIIIEYHGRRLQPNSTRSLTFSGFYRNSIKVEGSYNVTVTDSTATPSGNPTDVIITFSHTTALTLTFPDTDHTTITRNAAFTVVWDYKISTPLQSTVTLKQGGGASGNNRKGIHYEMAITKDIVYRLECFASGFVLPVSGEQTIAVTGGKTYTIKYGDSACDNTVTILVDGKTVTVTVGGDGN